MRRLKQPAVVLLACTVAASLPVACDPADDPAEGDQLNANEGAVAARVVFPDKLRVKEESVNEFVETAMRTSAAGNYEDFRLLWSVHGEPLDKAEYERGWQAILEIRVLALEKALVASDADDSGGDRQVVYALLAEVAMDPARLPSQEQARRDVALMLLREHDQWRLTRAPKRMRTWIREKAGIVPEATAEAGTQPSKQMSDD